MSLSAKRSAYSDMPSFSSQSAICSIAAPAPGSSWPDRASGPGQRRAYPTNSRHSRTTGLHSPHNRAEQVIGRSLP